LGFVHVCAQRRNDGKFTVRRKTIAKRQRTTIKRVKEEQRKQMHANVHRQGMWLSSVVRGFYNYFGVPGNRSSLNSFRTQICHPYPNQRLCVWLEVGAGWVSSASPDLCRRPDERCVICV